MYSKNIETTKFYEKDAVDRTIDNVLKTIDGELSQSDLNKVAVAASVESGISRYRTQASGMSLQALESEEHDSSRLSAHLVEKFGARPPRVHAHAIVAGKHKLCAPLRLAMAMLKVRIDDVDNGCWLPESSAATPHPAMPSAPPHSRIHRFNYYSWISSKLTPVRRSEGLSRTNLKLIAKDLYTGSFPEYVMLPKGVKTA